jgi:NAD(P)-dependent dehydrogenase (short-subunit alcohol dehydrogenase family)
VTITTTLVEQANAQRGSVLASLTNGGLAAETKSLALSMPRPSIRVNAVSPRVIRTPMHAPDTYEQLDPLHPVGRMGEISDVVEAVPDRFDVRPQEM